MDPAITFIDLAGFTALTEAHGDEHAADLIERFVSMSEERASERDRVVKSIGDAVLLRSDSATDAVRLASELMHGCADEPDFPLLRGGIHTGTVIERNGDVFGGVVNLAARIAAQAHGGQLLVSDTTYAAIADPKPEVVDLGSFSLRNVTDPIRLFELTLGLDHGLAGVDPVCRMRVERDHAGGRLRHDGIDYWLCSLDCAAKFAANPEAYIDHIER